MGRSSEETRDNVVGDPAQAFIVNKAATTKQHHQQAALLDHSTTRRQRRATRLPSRCDALAWFSPRFYSTTFFSFGSFKSVLLEFFCLCNAQ